VAEIIDRNEVVCSSGVSFECNLFRWCDGRGGADTTTELQGLHLMFELMFILFLLISVFVVLPRFQEELLLRALHRSLLPPMRLLRVAS